LESAPPPQKKRKEKKERKKERKGKLLKTFLHRGQTVMQLVETLPYQPKSRWFSSQWRHLFFLGIMGLGSTQPLIEMSTRNVSWG